MVLEERPKDPCSTRHEAVRLTVGCTYLNVRVRAPFVESSGNASAGRNSQTWIRASLDLPGPGFGFGFGMCEGDRWRYCTTTRRLVWTDDGNLLSAPATEATEIQYSEVTGTLVETQRLATNHALST